MSYDLLVFDPDIAPRDREAFMIWYRDLTKWVDQRDYNSLDGTSENLCTFYNIMKTHFPPMNGREAYEFPVPPPPRSKFWTMIFGPRVHKIDPRQQLKEAYVTDYCIAKNAIYMAFASSIAADAYSAVVSTALKSGVGFFDVSAPSGAILHDPDELSRLEIL
jgi:hypothetical protein